MAGPIEDQLGAFDNAKNLPGYSNIKAVWSTDTGSPRMIHGFKDLRLAKLDTHDFGIDKRLVREFLRGPGASDKLSKDAIDRIKDALAGIYCHNKQDFSIAPLRISLDSRYRLTIRLQQTVKVDSRIVPVHRFGLTLHLPNTLSISRITGLFAPKVEKKKPVSNAAKIKSVIDSMSNVQGMVPGQDPTLTYLPMPSKSEYPLAWRCLVRMSAKKKVKGPVLPFMGEVFIDDASKKVLRRTNLISGFECSGVPYYPRGQGNPPIIFKTIKQNNVYHLEDRSLGVWANHEMESGLLIRTKRCQCSSGNDVCSCTPLYCEDNCTRNPCPSDPDPCTCPTAQSPNKVWDSTHSIEVESHANTGAFFLFMRSRFGHEGASQSGPDVCELCACHDSASTSFFYPPAPYSGLPYRVYIPSRSTNFDAFCGKDIIAHEWTHAIIDALYGPEGTGYEAAINEALCDAFASFFLVSEGERPWLLGCNWRGGERDYYRSMEDPSDNKTLPLRARNKTKSKGDTATASYVQQMVDFADEGFQPDHFESRIDPNRDPTPDGLKGGFDEAKGWARINSGIINKATYLMCEGGSHGATGDQTISIYEGLGMDLTMNLYYSMLGVGTCYSFEDMRDELLGLLWDELEGTYGIQSQNAKSDRQKRFDYILKVSAVINSFSAVGVPEGDAGVIISSTLLDADKKGQLDPTDDLEIMDIARGIENKYGAVEFPDWFFVIKD